MTLSVMKTRTNSRSAIMKRLYGPILAAVGAIAGLSSATAEDIDLFVQPSGIDPGLPNVLIVLDNTANWNTPFTFEMAALSSTVNALETNDDGSARLRLGLMLFTETGTGAGSNAAGQGNNTVDGGYVRAAIRDLTLDNKNQYVALVNALDITYDKSNGGKAGKTMADAYMYFSGLAPYTGNRKAKTDFTGNALPTSGASYAASNAIYALSGNALNAYAGSPYNSPIVTGSCAGNYIIYLSNGPVQDNSSDNSTAATWLQTQATAVGLGAGATTTIPLSPSGSQSNIADEWARFMKKSPRAITVYTIDVVNSVTGQTAGWSSMLGSMASVSAGKYFYVNGTSTDAGEAINRALGTIFSEIQAVNSVFASVSLPTSVNTEGTYLNQVYIGMFRPDTDALPRWPGNLKQYKLGLVGSQLRTLDADGLGAINSSTGFISECARSYWTPTAPDTYWAFRPQGGCVRGGVSFDNSNSPDGKVVEKGAQAYVRRSDTTRTMLTCSSVFASCSSAGSLTAFDAAAATKALLGDATMTDAAHTNYVDWHLGLDVAPEEKANGVTNEMRPSVHGDIVHSRPIALNYGTDEAPKVVVFYGGNDGVLRAVNGNRTTDIGVGLGNVVVPGQEFWAFTPPEFYPQIKRLRDNNVTISYHDTTITDPTPLPKPYGMDGAITTYNNTSLFVGMRRGGRALYTFDVTGIADNNPADPTLLWKIGCPNLSDDTDCQSDYINIGQTWSGAKVLRAAGYVDGAGAAKPMLIMGGGYDACEDQDPATCTSTNKGHSIYLIDAATGTKLNEFTTDRGVIGDVFVITDPVSGLAKWAYAADLGGNIYRISGDDASIAGDDFNTPFNSTDPAEWNMTKIASLGCNTTTACSTPRKFMFMPDIVEKEGTYYLLLGSGDREKPLDAWPSAYNTSNYMFMVMDNPLLDTWLSDESTNGVCGGAVLCLNSLLAIPDDQDPDPTALAGKKGWYLSLRAHEQVVTSAITVFGTTTFSTHTPVVPDADSCESTLGTARVYNIRFLNAAASSSSNNRDEEVVGGGLPPSPVAGMVTLDDGTTVPFIIGGNEASPLESNLPEAPSTGTQPKSLTYWYIEKQ
jgi:type IV pilus assembly protein PilY1